MRRREIVRRRGNFETQAAWTEVWRIERHGPFIYEQVAWCGYTQDEQEAKYETEKAGWNQMM